jgi:ADP-ribose pyrophosphatase YjhB (NUDIX family)
MNKRIVECVGALIFDDEKKICLQQRDDKPEINCPGLWGLFGGSITKNESLEKAVKREVFEELSVLPKKADFFLKLELNSFIYSEEIKSRSFFSVFFSKEEISKIILKEGKSYKFFSVDQIPHIKNLAPADSCAITMFTHHFLQPRQITPIV